MRILENVPLADRTSLRIGGAARWYCEPSSADDAREALAWAARERVPVFVLGRGTNLVISDRGFQGLVLCAAERLSWSKWDGDTVVCGGGLLLHALVREAAQRSMAGIECLAGIPGSIGGAVVMNAGAFGQEIGPVVSGVECMTMPGGECLKLDHEALRFSYRHSTFSDTPAVILEVTLRLHAGDGDSLASIVRDTVARRKDKQPLDLPNCGSVFKNPPGQGAGRHIEAAGLKGYRIGGMEVSAKHANFFVNTGGASAEDFRELVARVRRIVRERTGVALEPEVLFVGEFSTPIEL